MPSKVYFMDDHAGSLPESTPIKAVKLLRDAGLRDMVKKGDTVGIKIHTGNFGNSLNLRPHWIVAIVDEVKRLGGYPVIVETNTGINGFGSPRADSIVHKTVASRHGFNEETMGCPIWLPDGVMDLEGVKCEVPHGVFLNYTYVSTQMTRLDKIIVVSHFKGHNEGTIGGAIKNIGIGMASGHGKACTHFANHPKYGIKATPINAEVSRKMIENNPAYIDAIIKACPFDCYEIKDGELVFHSEQCRSCTSCFYTTMFSGLRTYAPEVRMATPTAIADSCAGIMNKLGKENFIFVNYAFDITPACDCNPFHDRPIVPNIGTFVSRDPVAIDMACIEACESYSAIAGSAADVPGLCEPNTERFTNISSWAKVSQWAQINAGVYNGIGSSEYVLVESEPISAAETSTWVPYGANKPVSYVYRDLIRKTNFKLEGDPAVAEPRLSVEKLNSKPTGKVGVISIKDDEEAGK